MTGMRRSRREDWKRSPGLRSAVRRRFLYHGSTCRRAQRTRVTTGPVRKCCKRSGNSRREKAMQRQKSMESSIQPGDTVNPIDEMPRHAGERTASAPVQGGDYLASVIVPRATSSREITALETAMQGRAPDARHPVALELAATTTSRQFLLRATSAMSQKHLCDQVQARYPQAIIRQLIQEDDPLMLHEGEVVSAVELRAGAAAYLP